MSSFGSLPRVAYQALQELSQKGLEGGCLDPAAWEECRDLRQGLREGFAQPLNAYPEEVALSHDSSEGMSVGTLGFDRGPGDEAVITSA